MLIISQVDKDPVNSHFCSHCGLKSVDKIARFMMNQTG